MYLFFPGDEYRGLRRVLLEGGGAVAMRAASDGIRGGGPGLASTELRYEAVCGQLQLRAAVWFTPQEEIQELVGALMSWRIKRAGLPPSKPS